MSFILDVGHVRRAQTAIGETVAERVLAIAARPGNPLRAEVRRYDGGAVATRAPTFGEHQFNRGYGFCDDHLEAAKDVTRWYADAGVAGAFEVAPGVENGRLMQLLHASDYRHTAFHAAYAGPPGLPRPIPAPGVEVRQVSSEEELEAFSDAYHAGWGHTGFRVPMNPWLGIPGWRLYLGLCDGAPAGAAILRLSGPDAYLADSAVAPGFRRRGVHQALLDRRCADAAAAGATAIFSGAEFLSGSSRNMQRMGLGLLYTKAIWTAGAPVAPGD